MEENILVFTEDIYGCLEEMKGPLAELAELKSSYLPNLIQTMEDKRYFLSDFAETMVSVLHNMADTCAPKLEKDVRYICDATRQAVDLFVKADSMGAVQAE